MAQAWNSNGLGGLAERFNAAILKTVVGESPPAVRILALRHECLKNRSMHESTSGLDLPGNLVPLISSENGPYRRGEEPMRQGRFSEEQMAAILREADRGSVTEAARKHKVSEQMLGNLDRASEDQSPCKRNTALSARCRLAVRPGQDRSIERSIAGI